MQFSRFTWRMVEAVLLVGLLSLAGCMLLQPRVLVDFEANPVSGTAPHLVDFAPILEAVAGKYEWDFGDGVTSTEVAPSHIYRVAGEFTVSLTVRFCSGDVVEAVKADLIEVVPELSPATSVGQIYWLDRNAGTISAGDREGHGTRTLLSSIHDGRQLAVGGGRVYWTTDSTVRRANLDGSGAEILYQDTSKSLQGIAVDPDVGKVYWVVLPGASETGGIWMADLDRGGRQLWATKEVWGGDSCVPWLLATDTVNGRLYWLERYFEHEPGAFPVSLPRPMAAVNCSVHWTSLDSFRDQLVLSRVPESNGLALDVGLAAGARYVYWTDAEANRVTRCKPDRTAYAFVLEDIDNPIALAIDAKEGKIYWSGSEGIHRANLNGSEQELIFPDVLADALALDL
jgi:PKD repeat protein